MVLLAITFEVAFNVWIKSNVNNGVNWEVVFGEIMFELAFGVWTTILRKLWILVFGAHVFFGVAFENWISFIFVSF